MRTLGMIGGTSWHSTIEYYRLINLGVGEKIGTQENPPLILHSINIALMREQNKEKINHAYLEISRKLQQAGAEAVIICANTPHMVYDHVQPQIEIPILHIAEAIGNKAREFGINKLGLLGNRPTMTGDFIPTYLRDKFQITTLIPENFSIDRSHYFVSKELTQGVFSPEAKSFYKDQIIELQKMGAEGVILGCTELPLLLSQEDAEIPLIETTQLHAKAAVDFILSDT
ncbi:MAG: amino acid racemase [Flavobacteriaceae bacterium]|nr:amino acid racemase [Flavobacteriaceae bacterium]MDH3795815.1 amino acid racemase [Flavobacteriaceae bacterium]